MYDKKNEITGLILEIGSITGYIVITFAAAFLLTR